jgi:G6PDH family F420-dependent oxidoreductase
MVRFGILAAHEQVNPTDLLTDIIRMDENGIERCWTSDHYMPWSHTGASGGAAWPWLGAALAKTNRIKIGTGVTSPILRYHPAIVAQVFATLGYMFPNRVFLSMGRGEALNEVPSGNHWPSNFERFQRLREAIHLIKKLWSEQWVTFKGKYYWVKDSNLYTKPKESIPLYISGNGPLSAILAGEEGDGFVTAGMNADKIKNVLLPAVKKGARRSGKDYESLEKILFVIASYDEDWQRAIRSVRFWKGSMINSFFEVDVHDPRKIEDNGKVVGDSVMEKMTLVISNAEEGIKKLQKLVNLGLTEIVLINSSPVREKFVKLLSERIAPEFNNTNNSSLHISCS